MTKSQIITHRGLEPSNPDFYSESSFEAFKNHLNQGFGIEFDPNFTKDGIIIVHDSNLARITNNKDQRAISDLTTEEALNVKLGNGKLCVLEELLELIKSSPSKINALHLKGKFQKPEYLDKLIDVLEEYPDLIDRIFIFDIKPDTAKYLKQKNPKLLLAPSVSHSFDIQRYNDAVLETLITVEDAIKYRQEGLFDWVWLDEWDRKDKDGKDKKLYTKEVFDKLRAVGYKIALVTPELHTTSPGLLGGESHPDGKDKKTFHARLKEIISLNPDAICTDHPEEAMLL
ncbi:MAG: glycerophosphodiester phosphodiesterase family protein [Candidatus Levybacteria bacterium]|nr:glycerophosphodiester phosphodiesterase family protein [Candidatus Levybacteria bacterium]